MARADGTYHEDGSQAGWIIAIILIVLLLTLGFFAYQNQWFGIGQQPDVEIEQPAPDVEVQPPAQEPDGGEPGVAPTQSAPTSP